MVTKADIGSTNIDWDAVSKATEVPRTYLVYDRKHGREFFRMYKPSEAAVIFKKKNWEGKIISSLNRKY